MAMTTFVTGHELAVKRWSTSLAVEAAKKSYFSKFIGEGPDSIIVLKNELHKAAGDKITVGLRMKLVGSGAEGDTVIENQTEEEALTFHNDFVFIDQLRKSTKSKGKMTEQRVPYNLRKEGRDALSTWWAETIDENCMCYLAAHRGIDPSFKTTPNNAAGAGGWTGRCGNAFEASDAGHQLYAGTATAFNNITALDIIDLEDVERMLAIAETVDPMMQALNIKGEKKFVLLMHTFQAFQLRQNTTTNDWVDIHKNTDGADSLIYKNALGEYAGVVLHKHRNVIRFSNAGAAGPPGVLDAARALFLGAQAGLMAYGQNSSPQRYSWNEDKDDRGNALAITAGTIFGVKKTAYKVPGTPGSFKNFGVIALDSYCPSPI